MTKSDKITAPTAMTTTLSMELKLLQKTNKLTSLKKTKFTVATQTKVHTTKQVQFSTNLCTVIGMKKHVTKLLKAHDVDANISITNLMAALGMHRDYLVETNNFKNKGKKESS